MSKKLSYTEIARDEKVQDGLDGYVNNIVRSRKGKTFLWLISYFCGILHDAGYNVEITKKEVAS